MSETEAFARISRSGTGISSQDRSLRVFRQGSGDGPSDLSPEQYAQRIFAFSSQNDLATLFPGHHYANLAKFLNSPYQRIGRTLTNPEMTLPDADLPTAEAAPAPAEQIVFASIQDLNSHRRRIEHLNTTSNLERFLTCAHNSANPQRQVLFLKGFPSAEWLNQIGSKFFIDPELFLRHMTFLNGTDTRPLVHCMPGMQNTIQIRLFTTGSWDLKPEYSIQEARRKCKESMKQYQEDMRLGKLATCSSIVRNFTVHSRKTFSIEQMISIHLVQNGGSWVVLVWNDAGLDLGTLEHGPWIEARDSLSWSISLDPVIQHRQHLALKVRKSSFTGSRGQVLNNSGTISQAATYLCHKYGQYLNTELMQQYPFYALHDLFKFVAASHWAFMRAMEQNVMRLVSSPEDDNAIQDFERLRLAVEQILESVRETLLAIRARGGKNWSHDPVAMNANNEQLQMEKDQAAVELEDEFNRVLDFGLALSKRCSDGTTSCVNRALQTQTQKSTQQTEATKKLAMLAFIFAPISWTASFLNIQFVELIGRVDLWLYFAVTGPVLAISILVMLIDTRRRLRQIWEFLKSLISIRGGSKTRHSRGKESNAEDIEMGSLF